MFNYVKNSLSKGIRSRILILTIFMILLAAILIYRLFDLQIINGEDYLNNFTMSIRKERTIKSTRGTIYDSDGNPLAYSQLAYSVVFEDNLDTDSTEEHNLALNGILYGLMNVIEENGDEIITDFGIALDENGEFYFTYSGFNLQRFKADIYGQPYIDGMTEEQANATADQMIADMSEDYGLEAGTFTEEERAPYGLPDSYSQEVLLKMIIMRSNVAANPAPNSTPLTAGIPKKRGANVLSSPSYMAPPIPAGMLRPQTSTTPPTESLSSMASHIRFCISSLALREITAISFVFKSFSRPAFTAVGSKGSSLVSAIEYM